VGVELPRGTVTFLFSDIEGSTRLSREHGTAYGDLRADHREVLKRVVAANLGAVVDTEGDAFFAAFERATEAVTASIAAQRELAVGGPVSVRIGIHTTEAHLHRDGYIGVGVTRAARICAAAHGGQVLLSEVTAGIVDDQSLPGIQLRDLGRHYLKDIPQVQRLFQVEAEGLRSDFPHLAASDAAGSVGTLLITDLSGWTRVMRILGDDAAAQATEHYHRIVEEEVRMRDGRQVERIGDHTLSLFPAPGQAIIAAAAVRRSLRETEWIAATERPELCAAIHTGRLPRPLDGQFGSPAFRVTRLCAAAEPGQILVSHATHALLEGELLHGVELQDLGERQLTPTEAPARVYELLESNAS